jgi:hypothetical protein
MLAALLVAVPTSAVDIEWAYVGDSGNAPDTATNCTAYGFPPGPGGLGVNSRDVRHSGYL